MKTPLIKCSLLIALLIYSFQTFSQFNQKHWISRADSLYNEGKYDSALFYLQKLDNEPYARYKLLETYWKKGDYNECLNGIATLLKEEITGEIRNKLYLLKGKALFSIGQPQASVSLMDSIFTSLKTPDQKADALNTKSKGLIWVGEIPQAIIENAKADSIVKTKAVNDPILSGNIYNVDGILWYFQGDFDKAIDKFKEAIAAKSIVLATSNPDIISLFGNTGVMYKNKLEYDKALQYYGYELENYIKSIGHDHLDVATTYLNIGVLYNNKAEYDLSLEAFHKSLGIREKKLGNKNPLTLDVYEWLGSVYGSLGDYESAKNQFLQVLDGRIKLWGEINHYVSYTYYNLGEAYLNIGDPQMAIKYFRKAVDIGEKVYNSNNYDQASNYNGLAMGLDQLGDYTSSRKYFFLSVEESLPGFKWNGKEDSPPTIENYLRFQEIFTSLIGLAKSHQRYDGVNHLTNSIKFIVTAKDLLEALKRDFTSNSDKITIARSAKELADIAISVYYELYTETGNEENLIDIFRWSEYVKGTTLLSTISDHRAKQFSGIPDSLLIKEQMFRIKKDSIKTLMIDEGVNKESSLISDLLALDEGHVQLIKFMEDNYPDYSTIKYGVRPMELNDILNSINDPEEAIIQYFISTNNVIYISAIKQHQHTLITTKNEELPEYINLLRTSIEDLNEENFRTSSIHLFETVFKPIKPFLSGITKLTIIPDGMLGYVPFELLLDERDNYLFNKYLIKYDLSSTIHLQNHKTAEQTEFLAYAPEFIETSETLKPLKLIRSSELMGLPGAKDEIANIEKILGGQLRIGSVATETLFKSEAMQYSILHLATHSIINQGDPGFTKLMFAPTQEDDGALHIYELENLTINAKMVTLSACNTGIGKIAAGEGVMSLARSFRSIGVPSVVMSLWPASDKSTPELMKYFYQNIKDGQPKDLALNNARKEYLKNASGKALHPFYWGGFVLIGDNSPIFRPHQILFWSLPSFLVLLLIVIGYRKSRKPQS